MRNPIYVLKSLEENAVKKDYKYERLYRNLYNPEFYLLAYQNIAKSQGSMTEGVDGMTLDDMSNARISRIISSLKNHSYQPNPTRRINIPKNSNPNKTRPLGIPSADDRLVQEVVRMILEAIYEPTFSKYSHGFRPKRSCHTALNSIQVLFSGAKWIIEGDIKSCFDSFDHHVLVNLLKNRIRDEYFIALMWKFLKAGYMEQWQYNSTYSGTPQGAGISPIISNIYLSELDSFLEKYKETFDTPECYRKTSRVHNIAENAYRNARHNLENDRNNPEMIKAFKNAQKEKLDTPIYPAIDPSYKRMQFNRYADDFVIGVIGSKSDTDKIKSDVKDFLEIELKLTLSEEKTNVTHSGEMIRYLGYDFTIPRCKDKKRRKDGILQRFWYGKVRLYLPKEKWVQKLRDYNAFNTIIDGNGKEKWIPMHRGFLMHKPDVKIVSKYNSEIRGLYNYYCLATNVSVLSKFRYIIRRSMEKTFAAKYNTSSKKIRDKYTRDGVFSVKYNTKSGEKCCEFYHDGFKTSDKSPNLFIDTLPQYRKYAKPNSLAKRLNANVCELCSAQTTEIHMHHVKRLKDLIGKNEFELLMMEKRRKSLALCLECYKKTTNTAQIN